MYKYLKTLRHEIKKDTTFKEQKILQVKKKLAWDLKMLYTVKLAWGFKKLQTIMSYPKKAGWKYSVN